jgi:SAM-dependent methyltransferase
MPLSASAAALRWICPGCGGEPLASETRLTCPGCGGAIDARLGIWHAQRIRPARFPAERRDHLAGIDSHHFWFPARRRLLEGLLTRGPTAGGGPAIELGCGNGGFLGALAARHPLVVGVDAYPESLGTARERAPGAVLVEADVLHVPLAAGQFEVAAALDVLEHVEADALLAEVRRLLAPGGWLLVSVPAFPSLWSALDEAARHRCRYRRRVLAAELVASGFELRHWTHYQALLFPLVWLSRRLPSRGAVPFERRPPRWLGHALDAVNHAEVALLGGLRLPWGTSLCVLARRLD